MGTIIKALALLIACTAAEAATYYVDKDHPSASDSNDGSQSTPWLTIQKAATTATAGDTVNVMGGVYNEYIAFPNDGSSGNVITFNGERGGGGEWLTIIDPSTAADSGWAAAPEIGTGVYKKDVGLHTKELTIAGERVAFVYSIGNIASVINSAYPGSGLTTGAEFLALASNATLPKPGGGTVTWWDGIEACWGTGTGADTNITYLRLRGGTSPDGIGVRVAKNDAAVATDLSHPAINLNNRSYIVFKNFMVRGAFAGLRLFGASTHHITIQDNFLSGGYKRIGIATGAHDLLISGNYITTSFYGYDDPGAWEGGSSIRENLYLVSKYLMGTSESLDESVAFLNAGNNNTVTGNTIYKGIGEGIVLKGNVAAPSTSTIISSNSIANNSSTGITLSSGHTGTEVFGNLIVDCNLSFRFHSMDTGSETDRVVYVHRNKAWQPSGIGNHFFIHFNNATADTYQPEFWVYHNSFSGGEHTIAVSSHVVGSGGLTGCHFINNIISGATRYLNDGEIGAEFLTNAPMVAEFDYNLIAPPEVSYQQYHPAAWWGANNIEQEAAEWASGNTSLSLASGSAAIDSAMNISSTYPLLPVIGVPYDAGWDIGAFEFNSNPPKKPRRNGPGRFRGM